MKKRRRLTDDEIAKLRSQRSHQAYMRRHKRQRRKLPLPDRIAAKLRILVPRVYAVIDGEPARELEQHAEIAASVREKLHIAGTALRDALRIVDPEGPDGLLLDTGLADTELRRAVLGSVGRAPEPVSVLELLSSTELTRWSASAVRRTLAELGRAGLLDCEQRVQPGQAAVPVWSRAAP